MNVRCYILLSAFLFTCTTGLGQVEQMIIPGDSKQLTIVTEPVTLMKGYFRTGLEAGFIVVDKVFNEQGKRDYIQGMNAWGKFRGFIWSSQYGLSDRWEVSLKIPYIGSQYLVSVNVEDVYQENDTLITYRSKGRGLGDIEIETNYQVLQETETRPAIVVGFDLTVPSGRKNPTNIKNEFEYNYPTGNGCTSLAIGVVCRKIMHPYSVRLRAHYEYNFKGKKIPEPYEDETEFKDADVFIIGGNFSTHLNDWIALSNEVAFNWFGEEKLFYETPVTDPAAWTIDYNPSLSFQIRRVRFIQGILIPITGKNNLGADPAYAFGLQYIF